MYIFYSNLANRAFQQSFLVRRNEPGGTVHCSSGLFSANETLYRSRGPKLVRN